MKILFVCPTDPRETSYGGQQRTHVIWKGLQTVGEVWTVVPVAHKRLEERDVQNRIYKLCLERRYSASWFVQRIVFWMFPQLAVPMGLKLVSMFEHIPAPDVCVARTLWVAARFRMWKIAPLFVDVDDTPTVDFRLANPRKKLKCWVLKKWQDWVCIKARMLWVPDPEQIEGLKPFNAEHLPNVPVGDYSPVDRSKVDMNRILFLGYLAHRPNVVAVEWFLKNIWVVLKQNLPDIKLDVVGGGLPSEYNERWSQYQDVKLYGFVRDVVPFFERSLALVTPMQIGSGTCIKVLESLARGVPVVSTAQGLRGIPVSDRRIENGLLQFSNGAELAECLLALRRYGDGDSRFGAYVEKHYSQAHVSEILKRSLA